MKNSFREYLEKKGFYSGNDMVVRARRYEEWLNNNDLSIKKSKYQDVMNYIGYLKTEGKKGHIINTELRAIGHYYEFKGLQNLTYDVRVKQDKRGLVPLFKEEELNQIYESFKSESVTYYRHSDKLILGLIIYQGLSRRELLNLEIQNLNLEKGTLYIRGGRSRNVARTLSLESHQIIPLYHYIKNHREDEGDKLFSRQSESLEKLRRQLEKLAKQVKGQSEKLGIHIIKLSQLRQSRVSIWVKKYGLRKAQYLGGFRNVNSVEYYQTEDLENLQEQVRMYHPLG